MFDLKESLKTDPLNLCNGRNQRNTPLQAYNCGGLALSVYDWVTPYLVTDDADNEVLDNIYTDDNREYQMEYLADELFPVSDIENIIASRDVEYLLNHYPFLQQVNLEDCAPTDRVIAYRIFIVFGPDFSYIEDTDFHFKVRINNFWFEKMGGEEVRLCQLDADKPWNYPEADSCYTSKIAYFKDTRY